MKTTTCKAIANAVPATRGQLNLGRELSMFLVSVMRVAARSFVLAALRRNDPPRSGGGNL